ncbi:putative chitinase SCDLUD_003223 [Saccharomycodes ludwigii]|uniref:putative chitinase n=1 Tax=Saccharomycodes ludwigii TaxID=36035 RepID=UPI001E8920F2|nr:hypothetical protein SCDLUD_003223 [Saccharomycodes ludwigii]KAH3900251.1 hypothetical protein SCDLUD_003223 [Saccharomycodes ludwigii]
MFFLPDAIKHSIKNALLSKTIPENGQYGKDNINFKPQQELTIPTDKNTTNDYICGVYYTNWSPYPPRNHFPQQIDFTRITNVYYSFFIINPKTGKILSSDDWADFEMNVFKKMYIDLPTNQRKKSDKLLSYKNADKILGKGLISEFYYLKTSAFLSQYSGLSTHGNFKTVMSIGGWSNKDSFHLIAHDNTKFNNFINSAVDTMFKYGFDGIDIDWEFPVNDGVEPVKFLNMVRIIGEKLNMLEKNIYGTKPQNIIDSDAHFLLTVAIPCAEETLSIMKLNQMDRYVDYWNLMAYDFKGEWSTTAGFHSNLYNKDNQKYNKKYKRTHFRNDESELSVDLGVKYLLNNTNINSKKIILGMPMYGRGFTHVNSNSIEKITNGSVSYSGVGGLSDGEPGMWLYNQLPLRNGNNAKVSASSMNNEHFDSEAVSAYSFDPNNKTFVGYDNQQSMVVKAEYVQKMKLGGGFWWESCGENSAKPLIKAFHDSIPNASWDSKKQKSLWNNSQVIEYYLKEYGEEGFLSKMMQSQLYRKNNS